MTYPSGAVITYAPDAVGRMLSVVDTTHSSSPINYVTGATYNAPGTLTGSVYGQNGASQASSAPVFFDTVSRTIYVQYVLSNVRY